MKPYILRWVVVLVATLVLCPLRMQAQAAAEYAITTSAVGTLGAKIGSALGAVAKQVPQTVQKDIPKPPSPNLDAQPKAAAEKTTEKTTEKITKTGVNTVHINSTPSGASIFVDNVALGHTPASLNLPKGIHAIEVRHDGYIAWHQAILLSEGESLSLNPTLKDPKTSPPLFTVQR